MNLESKVLNAAAVNGDINVLLAENVDDLFVSYADIWQWVKQYRKRYGVAPSQEKLQEQFPDEQWQFTPKESTKSYLDQLRDQHIKSRIRQILLDTNDRLAKDAGQELLRKLSSNVNSLGKLNSGVRDLNVTDYENALNHYEQQRERVADGGAAGISTGFKLMDASYTTGMAPGHLIVVIGWSGKGKTWFTSYLASKAWMQGYKPMIVSLEMSPEGMRDRILTILGSGMWRNTDLQRGAIDEQEFTEWAEKTFLNANDFIIVSNEGSSEVTPSMVQGKIEQYRPDIVFLDYHQLFADDQHSQSEIVRNRNISRSFKHLATTNNIPIVDITAATMSDVSDTDVAPMIEQVAWSKSIQYDADLALAIHKPEDAALMEIICRKNRWGPEFAFYLQWAINEGLIEEVLGND